MQTTHLQHYEPLERIVNQPPAHDSSTPFWERVIARKIQNIRGCHVVLDRDLAALHGMQLPLLKALVRRNRTVFSQQDLFALTPAEQNEIGNAIGPAVTEFAFTETGILIIASLLQSEKIRSVTHRIQKLLEHISK